MSKGNGKREAFSAPHVSILTWLFLRVPCLIREKLTKPRVLLGENTMTTCKLTFSMPAKVLMPSRIFAWNRTRALPSAWRQFDTSMRKTVGCYRFNIQIEFMDVSMSSSSNSTIVIHHKLHDLSHPKVPFGIKKWKMDVHPDGSKLPITATIHLTAKVRGLSAVLLLLPPF